jgi:hypothetical protein
MSELHPHRHTIDTECLDENCGRKRHEEYVHSHPDAHVDHQHKTEPAKVIKLEELEEESEPEPQRHSSIWHGPADE